MGTVQVLTSHEIKPDAVIFLEKADPGFDWIFQHDFRGLVTMYGGANSHMAIRAIELNKTAVIGAGTNLYCRWTQARLLRIDPVNRQVNIA